MINFEDLDKELIKSAMLYYETECNKIMRKIIQEIADSKNSVFLNIEEIKKTANHIHNSISSYEDHITIQKGGA